MAAARLKDRISVEDANITSLPYPDESFDVVVAEAVTMFVDRHRAAAELARVTRPGGRVLATGIYGGAGLVDIRTECGPFEMMTVRGFLADERSHAPAVMARAISPPAYLRKMAWLIPRMSRAIPYLGFVLVNAHKPRVPAAEST